MGNNKILNKNFIFDLLRNALTDFFEKCVLRYAINYTLTY